MPKTSEGPGKRLANPAAHSIHGHPAHNEILRGLPDKQREIVLSSLEFVELPTQLLLNEISEPIKYGYFLNGGLASVLNVMADGKSVEVGITGKEGFIGLPLLVGFKTSPTRTMMQVAGAGFRITSKDMGPIMRECPELEKRLHRYSQEFALQSIQLAACNRLHKVEARLARWLLMSQDRVDSPGFQLTQESLANMLGTRRASVTTAAGILQKAGLITYKRARVEIKKRAALEKAACECYSAIVEQTKNWSNGSQ
jgi:CRP-like cAMP-binding protein